MIKIDTSGLDRIIKKLESANDIKEIDNKVKTINKDASAILNENGKIEINGLNEEQLIDFKKNFLSQYTNWF